MAVHHEPAETPAVASTPALPDSPPQAESRPRVHGIVQYRHWGDLVRRIQERDRAAVDEFYHVFSRSVRFTLYKQLGAQDLDDAIHDIFLIVLEAVRRGNVRDPERLMGFVKTITRRQVAAYIEEMVQNRTCSMALDPTAPLTSPDADPEQKLIRRQRKQIAHKALESIPERDREILTRFYLNEEPQEQICIEMGLSDTQFRLLKSRAKARFGEVGKKRLVRHRIERLACA